MEATASAGLDDVLAHERRDGDRARDAYRHPAQTLAFFGIEPDMTVAEFSPGGGWYTRILSPLLAEQGQYIAFNPDSAAGPFRDRAQEARAKGWTERFKQSLAETSGVEADAVIAFETDEMPEEVAGTVDRVVIFRSMHGLNMRNNADDVLKAARAMLKDDGMVGVVQHRAPAGSSYNDYGARQRGYMRTEDVIAALRDQPGVADVHHVHLWLMEEHGAAFDAHIVAEQGTDPSAMRHALKSYLKSEFDLNHVTLELETQDSHCHDAKVIGH